MVAPGSATENSWSCDAHRLVEADEPGLHGLHDEGGRVHLRDRPELEQRGRDDRTSGGDVRHTPRDDVDVVAEAHAADRPGHAEAARQLGDEPVQPGPVAVEGGHAPRTVAACPARRARPLPLHPPMSTRRLILAALLCGLAILVAFTVQVALVL